MVDGPPLFPSSGRLNASFVPHKKDLVGTPRECHAGGLVTSRTSYLLVGLIVLLLCLGANSASAREQGQAAPVGHPNAIVPSAGGFEASALALGGAPPPPLAPASALTGGIYTVTFTETGLPTMAVLGEPLVVWTVQLGGATMSTNLSSLIFSVGNGTYPFNVPGPMTNNYGVNASTPSYGNISVNGADVSRAVSFSYSPEYPVTFIAVGTGNGGDWSVTFNGVTTVVNPQVDRVNTGGTNGTYRYSISGVPGFRAQPSAGLATVSGAWLNVTITFDRVLYNVTFNETGLKANNQWGIGLNPPMPPTTVVGGGTQNSTGSLITFLVSNGTFSFIVDGSGSYLATPYSGSIIVNGAPVNVSIKFVRVSPGDQWVTFLEEGLPSGTNWSLILNGTEYQTPQTSLSFQEPNGTYPVSIRSVAGLGPRPANLTVSVPANFGPFTIDFLPVYSVMFTESDLPNGTNWSVSVTANSTETVLFHGGPFGTSSPTVTRWSDGASTIRFYLSNGTYSYTSSAPGESGSAAPLSVRGATQAPVGLTFHATSSSSNILGEPDWVFPVVGVIIVVVIAAVLLVRRKRKTSPKSVSPGTGETSKSEGKSP